MERNPLKEEMYSFLLITLLKICKEKLNKWKTVNNPEFYDRIKTGCQQKVRAFDKYKL